MKIKYLDDAFRSVKHAIRKQRARSEIASRAVTPRPHDLHTPLVVSLTSFPPRFDRLAQTLKCLLLQTIAADRTLLWIAHADMLKLPKEVTELTALGLEIKACDDMRSYKKILPTLAEEPHATIVTADDDVYYSATWLENIVQGHIDQKAPVVCGRGHLIKLSDDGTPAPYQTWKMNHTPTGRSGRFFPTGVSGVLYAPGCFADDVTDWDTASQLCPTGDDVWLYWMHRLNGIKAAKAAGRQRIIEWTANPPESLKTVNATGGNDQQIKAMIDRYGFPPV
ncbi:glycosyltransferase family 2 protein [uncultured Tateyamaria sp.]|uniref:glycosyltransferase family 2 protein n=1 Tax=uncultured Tateyamaria sp. TaxID=455651 RepID=UPI00261A8755|nr:glycosyltransferase family 2 protein [uncultured Tateyamaria sp.]